MVALFRKQQARIVRSLGRWHRSTARGELRKHLWMPSCCEFRWSCISRPVGLYHRQHGIFLIPTSQDCRNASQQHLLRAASLCMPMS